MMPGRFNKKLMSYVGFAILIFTIAPVGFSESFSDRPAQAELETAVTLGMECARGARERCFATQTSTNPVTYSVSPPDFPGTNGGWYLNQTVMGQMASTARSLVSYYANPDTVYNGATNMTMLTVTGLWASLEIGDHTNQFTCTPASGTNTATYGDSPWKIYAGDMQERYKVLNACGKTKWGGTIDHNSGYLRGITPDNMELVNGAAGTTLSAAMNLAETWFNNSSLSNAHASQPEGYTWKKKIDGSHYKAGIIHGYSAWKISGICTNVLYSTPMAAVRLHAYNFYGSTTSIYDDVSDYQPYTVPSLCYTIVASGEHENSASNLFYVGDTGMSIIPWLPEDPASDNELIVRGYLSWAGDGNAGQIYIPWQFQYCTEESW